MKDNKQPKLGALSEEHQEALALLAARPEFKALEKLFHIEEQNIIIQSFKVNSSDPLIITKKAFAEGRIWELRKILNTFRESQKGNENE